MKQIMPQYPRCNPRPRLLTVARGLAVFLLVGFALQAIPALAAPADIGPAPQPVMPAQARAQILCVSPSGDYQTIQDAVDAAQDGDTILVASGTYEENVVITKTVEIAGRYLTDCTAKNDDAYGSTAVVPEQGRALTIDPARIGVSVVISDLAIAGSATGLGGAAPVAIDAAARTMAAWPSSAASAEPGAWPTATSWRSEVEHLAAQGLVPGGDDLTATMARIDAMLNLPAALPVHTAPQTAVAPMRANEVDCGGALYAKGVGLQLLDVSVGASVASQTGDGYGGGACILDTTADGLLIQGGQFTRVTASTAGAGIGGGVFVRGGEPGSVLIDNVTFFYNTASSNGTGWGGALAIIDVPQPVLTGEDACVFSINVASYAGSGQGGAALFLRTPGAQIDHCRFYSNYASGGGNGTSGGGVGPSSGLGGGLYVESSNQITITGNKFDFNVAQSGPPERNYRAAGGGALVVNSQEPVITANVFDRNTAGFSGQGYGGGLAIYGGQSVEPLLHATISENDFTRNWANVINYIGCAGGGLYAFRLEEAQIISNTFAANVVNVQGEAGITMPGAPLVLGGGAALNELRASVVAGNEFVGNAGTLGGFALGGGLGLRKSEQLTVADNTFRRNLANNAPKGAGYGGALAVEGGEFVAVQHNSFVENSGSLATAPEAGLGVSAVALIGDNLLEPARDLINLTDVTVEGNLILDSGRNVPAEAGELPPNNFALQVQGTDRFTVTNNVIAGSTLGGILAIYRSTTEAETHGAIHNNTFHNNGQFGIWLLSRWRTELLSIVNNSIVSHTMGVEGDDLFGAAEPVTLAYTLFYSNTQDLGPAAGEAITGTHTLTGNPAFVAPALHNFQLLPVSAARDTGDPAGVPPGPPLDLEGTPRPYGPRVDIGAYEWHAQGQAFLGIVAKE